MARAAIVLNLIGSVIVTVVFLYVAPSALGLGNASVNL